MGTSGHLARYPATLFDTLAEVYGTGQRPVKGGPFTNLSICLTECWDTRRLTCVRFV